MTRPVRAILRWQTCLGAIFASAILASTMPGPVAVAQSGERRLEEVVVTAQKREQSLRKVPISIGVVTGDMIEQYDMKDLVDLQSYVPSLSVQQTFGNWSVRIRGLGSGVTNLAFDSSVSIFNDGVYCARSQCLESALLDIERIEVARGPQGALFGKSTIAGAISLRSARPGDDLEGHIRLGAEFEDGGKDASAVLSGPLSDGLRARVAIKYTDRDGYIDNTFTGAEETAWDSLAWRLGLELDAGDNTSVYGKIEGSEKNEDGNTNQLVAPGLFGRLSRHPDNEWVLDEKRNVSTGTGLEGFENNEWSSSNLIVDTALGGHTLTGILGYSDLSMERYLDVDGVPENFLNTTLFTDYESASAELRLLSPGGARFDYITGAMFQTTDLTTRQYSPFGWGPFVADGSPDGTDSNFERAADTLSVYGQLTWNVSDRATIIADVRWTDEEQDGLAWAFPVEFPDLINPAPSDTTFGRPPGFYFRQKRQDDHVDPSIRFQYAFSDAVTAYVAYATGSKPGGMKSNDSNLGALLLAKAREVSDPLAWYQRFVGQSSLTPADLINGLTLTQGNGVMDFEDEQADNIEIGIKSVLAGGDATLNVALFRMDFENLQTASFDGTRFIIGNAASAGVRGIEIEGLWQATDALRLSGALAYLDTEYDDYPGAQCLVADASGAFRDPSCTDGSENLAGRPLQRTPELEVNLSANYETPVTDSMLLRVGATMYYSDSYHVQEDEHPLGVQDAYTKWNLRLALAAANDAWEVAFVARNLSDEQVIQHAYEIAGSYFNAIARGRTLSLEAIRRW